jgi:hypothetical protein
VVEVQERFDTSLVTASRMFVKEGDLIKMCRKGPKRFFFVLFNDLLVRNSSQHIHISSSVNLLNHTRKVALAEPRTC